jgi:hypothetical protein
MTATARPYFCMHHYQEPGTGNGTEGGRNSRLGYGYDPAITGELPEEHAKLPALAASASRTGRVSP